MNTFTWNSLNVLPTQENTCSSHKEKKNKCNHTSDFFLSLQHMNQSNLYS